MIVRCPECSTGFKLPDSKVSEKGVKLRCSKCSHVFRFRAGPDGEAEIFYTDADLERNSEVSEVSEVSEAEEDASAGAAAPDQGDEEADASDAPSGNRTQFGLPAVATSRSGKVGSGSGSLGAKLAKKLSKSASSDYNPFPHANLDLATNQQTSLGLKIQADGPDATAADSAPEADDELGWQQEATRVMDPDASDDPFDGAFDPPAPASADPESDPFDGAFGEQDGEDPAAGAEAASHDPAGDNDIDTDAAAKPAAGAEPVDSVAPAEPGAESAAAAQAAAAGAMAGATPFQMRNQPYRAEDMVDPSFGKGGPKFDPERGLVTDDEDVVAPSTRLTPGPAAAQNAPSAPPGAAPRPASARPAPAPAAPAATSPAPAPAPGATTKVAPKSGPAHWEAEPIDEPLAPHQIGGSGPQKFANFLLILLLVGLGFFGLVAVLSGGFLDLSRFSHTLEVAFQGADFQPRADWVKSAAPVVAPAPEEPIRFESVFATPVTPEKGEPVVLVRGKAKNIADHGFDEVELRAILYDKNERVIAQTTAPLGARIQPAQLAEAAASGDYQSLLPGQAAPLGSQTVQPFSLVFDKVPGDILKNADVSYRVEVAQKTATGSAATP